jgi:hypothetical protein
MHVLWPRPKGGGRAAGAVGSVELGPLSSIVA